MMVRKMQRLLPFVFSLAMMLVSTSCSSSTAIPDSEVARMQELGDVFVSELQNDILPFREKPDDLRALDVVMVDGDKTYNIDRLNDFYEGYKVGQDTELTIIFSTSSFVVTKVIFEGSTGYYLRYQYDQFNKDAITVSNQPLDKLAIAEDTKLEKVELTLSKEKRKDIVFSFKNIVAGTLEEESKK